MNLTRRLRSVVKDKPVTRWRLRPEILCCQQTPKPLHGVVPRIILGGAWWNKTRQEAYRSTNYHCQACGVQKYRARARQWLEGHELYEIDYLLGRMTYVETVPLCHFCHNYIHAGRLAAMLEKGKVHHSKFAAIIRHGDVVLAKYKLTKSVYVGPAADWADWRLLLFDKEYPPRYPTHDEWRKAFGYD